MIDLGAPARLRQLARLAILAQCLLAAFFVAGSYNAFTHLPRPTTTDFAAFYAAGRLADRGQAALAYAQAPHQAVEEAVTAPGIDYKFFLNPPPFLLLCAPLAWLPYLAAFLLFELATLALWLAVTLRIAGGGRLALLLLLATPSLYWAFGWGQNSFLTAGLMGLGTLLLRTRPGLAGLAFGALAIKPHFGVLLPVALLCGRHWRAIITAALTVVTLVAVSAAIFGVSSWRGFVEALRHSTLVELSGHIDAGGAVRLLGAPPSLGWAVQAAVSLAAAAAVGWAWLRRRRAAPELYESRMAALVAGTMAAMPFLLFYDLVMASVAAAWLAAAARKTGWRRGEIGVLGGLFVLVLLDFPAAGVLHLAIGCLVAPALLGLAVGRLRYPAGG
jgi:hypothetical protein